MPELPRSRPALPWCLACTALLGASAAHAIPSAANSHIPAHVLLVGRTGALADTAMGAFTIEVRDVANVPVAGSAVEFRVLNCSGARVGAESYGPGVSIRCGTHGYLGVRDATGEVRTTRVGAGEPKAPPSGGPCAQ